MIKIVTLINGEQIIGELFNDSWGTAVKIEDPYYIIDAVDEYGTYGSKLSPVLTLSSDRYILVDSKNIIFSFTASDIATKYYNKLKEVQSKSKDMSITQALQDLEEMDKRMDSLKKIVSGNKSVN